MVYPNFQFGSQIRSRVSTLNKMAALGFHYATVPAVNALGYATWSPSSWNLTACDVVSIAVPMLLVPPMFQASAERLTYRLSRTKNISAALGAGMIAAVAGCFLANEASLFILNRNIPAAADAPLQPQPLPRFPPEAAPPQGSPKGLPPAPYQAPPFQLPPLPPAPEEPYRDGPWDGRIQFRTPGFTI